MDDAELGERVRQARETAGVSVRSLAGQVGMDWSALGRSERGERAFKALELVSIAEALGTTMDGLVGTTADLQAAAALAKGIGEVMLHSIGDWVRAGDRAVSIMAARQSGTDETPAPWLAPGCGMKLAASTVEVQSEAGMRLALWALAEIPRMVTVVVRDPDRDAAPSE